MSRAVDRCPAAVRPLAFLKLELFIPSDFAVRFIRLANLSSDPDSASPMAEAASLADLIAAARIRWRRAIRCPAFSPSREGGLDAAFLDTVTIVSSETSPRSMASNTMYSVSILVSDAGCRRASAFLEYSVSPVRASIT